MLQSEQYLEELRKMVPGAERITIAQIRSEVSVGVEAVLKATSRQFELKFEAQTNIVIRETSLLMTREGDRIIEAVREPQAWDRIVDRVSR